MVVNAQAFLSPSDWPRELQLSRPVAFRVASAARRIAEATAGILGYALPIGNVHDGKLLILWGSREATPQDDGRAGAGASTPCGHAGSLITEQLFGTAHPRRDPVGCPGRRPAGRSRWVGFHGVLGPIPSPAIETWGHEARAALGTKTVPKFSSTLSGAARPSWAALRLPLITPRPRR